MRADTEWWYALSDERVGPVAPDAVRTLVAAGVIGPATLVWTHGMGDWLPAGSTTLAPLFGPAAQPGPPPFTPRTVPSIPAARASDAQPPPDDRPGAMGFGESVRRAFALYATIRGRAGRSEFWFFILFQALVLFAAALVDIALFGAGRISPVSALASLALLLPQITTSVRRLHDTDRSGWWLLVAFLPLVGGVVLLVFFCLRGTPGRNRFG